MRLALSVNSRAAGSLLVPPIEENGGLNLYGFVGNDPNGRFDYLGLHGRLYAGFQKAYWVSAGLVPRRLGFRTLFQRLRAQVSNVAGVDHMPFKTAAYDRNTRRIRFPSLNPLPAVVFHEMTHVYNHNSSGPDDARRDEGMGHVVEYSYTIMERLMETERRIRDPDRTLCANDEEIRWHRFNWSLIWSTWGQSYDSWSVTYYGWDFSSLIPWPNHITVSADPIDFDNVENHLGFRISCRSAASALNELTPNDCIRFTCSMNPPEQEGMIWIPVRNEIIGSIR